MDLCVQCVVGFDHHCDFINQCVGVSNYRQWCTFVLALWFMSTTEIIFTLSGIVQMANGDETGDVRATVGPTLFYILATLSIALQVPFTRPRYGC